MTGSILTRVPPGHAERSGLLDHQDEFGAMSRFRLGAHTDEAVPDRSLTFRVEHLEEDAIHTGAGFARQDTELYLGGGYPLGIGIQLQISATQDPGCPPLF